MRSAAQRVDEGEHVVSIEGRWSRCSGRSSHPYGSRSRRPYQHSVMTDRSLSPLHQLAMSIRVRCGSAERHEGKTPEIVFEDDRHFTHMRNVARGRIAECGVAGDMSGPSQRARFCGPCGQALPDCRRAGAGFTYEQETGAQVFAPVGVPCSAPVVYDQGLGGCPPQRGSFGGWTPSPAAKALAAA
jgi:hypothetical protein